MDQPVPGWRSSGALYISKLREQPRALERLEELMRCPGPSAIVGQGPGLCVTGGATVTGLAERGLIGPHLLAHLGDLVARFDEEWTVANAPRLLDVWQSLFVLHGDNPT